MNARPARAVIRPALSLLFIALLALSGEAATASAADSNRPAATEATIARLLPAGAHVLVADSRKVAGESFTFVKYRTPDGQVHVGIFDSSGARRSARPPSRQRPVIAEPLSRALQNANDPQQRFRVTVALQQADLPEANEPAESGSVGIGPFVEDAAGGLEPRIVINGEDVGEGELLARDEATRRNIGGAHILWQRRKAEELHRVAARQGWAGRAAVRQAIDAGGSSVTIELTAAEIARLAAHEAEHIAGVELWESPTADIASAMRSTRVDPYALNHSRRRGRGIGIYTTDVGCPGPGFTSNYTHLSGNPTEHSNTTTLILRAVAPDSWIYCRAGPTLPTAEDLNGYDGGPAVYVISQSYSQYNNAQYTTMDRDTDDFVYNNRVAHFNSCGNNGQHVKSPAKGFNVISIGNYNDATDTINPSSSWMDPETNSMKPELSMPGTNISVDGHMLTGTSAATPHAAAFAADLMSAFNWYRLRPQLLKAAMLAGASRSIAGGAERVGVGGGNFNRAYFNGQDYWWTGQNNAFASFDAKDPIPDNGTIDVTYDLPASTGNVRVALAWLTRGTYTYEHLDDPHPIGIDLDLVVYGPDGSVVAESASFDNPFELVRFSPAASGTYRFSIRRQANRDPASALRIGMKIDW